MRIRELRERRGLTGTELARMTVLECEVGDLYDDETLRAASEAARAAVAAKGAAGARALAAGK